MIFDNKRRALSSAVLFSVIAKTKQLG